MLKMLQFENERKRIVLLLEKDYCDDEIARIIDKSPALVKTYWQLYQEKDLTPWPSDA